MSDNRVSWIDIQLRHNREVELIRIGSYLSEEVCLSSDLNVLQVGSQPLVAPYRLLFNV